MNTSLGLFAFDNTSTITITHNLDQPYLSFAVIVDGVSRKDLVSSVTVSSGIQANNEFTVNFTSSITGVIELLNTEFLEVGSFSSTDNDNINTNIINLQSDVSTLQTDVSELQPNILYRYNSASLNIADGTTIDTNDANSTTCVFNTDIVTDSAYSYNTTNDIITFQEDGLYRVLANLSIDDVSGGRESSRCFLLLNNAQVNGGIGFGYHRNVANGENTVTINRVINISANDTLEVRSQCFSTGTLSYVANACSLYIEKIR